MNTLRFPAMVGLVLVGQTCLFAQDTHVRTIEKDGVLYRETRRTVTRPVLSTTYEPREQVIYRQKLRTEMRPSYRTYRTPVTEYRWTTRVRGQLNPFAAPYLAYEYRPVTWWENRAEVVNTPVTQPEWVAEKRTIHVPVTTHRMAKEEMTSTVAIGGAPSSSSTAVASRTPVGGVARMENDPPRQGSGWRSAGQTINR